MLTYTTTIELGNGYCEVEISYSYQQGDKRQNRYGVELPQNASVEIYAVRNGNIDFVELLDSRTIRNLEREVTEYHEELEYA